MKITDSVVNNFTINRGRVIQRSFSGREFTKNEIRNLVAKFQEKYKHKNLQLMLSVRTPFGFRSGRPFNINDDPSMVDDYEWDETDAWIIYAYNAPTPTGGCDDENNDCLYSCIVKLVSIFRLPKDLKYPEDLKKKLKLDRKDKIPLDRISEVENIYKVNINICGEFTYASLGKHKLTANLKLVSEHYEVEEKNNKKSRDLLKNIPFRKQKLVYFQYQEDSVKCYDGQKIYYLTIEEFDSIDKWNSENVYLDELPIKQSDFVEDYHTFIREAEKLKELTKGRIDLSHSGYKVVNEALKCVHYSLLGFQDPEPITPQEQEWLHECFKGGLIFCKSSTLLEKGYHYDKNSAYPHELCSDKFSFPVKKGEFKHLDSLPDILQYGIYKCRIEKSEDEDTNKLFRFNKKNYYTHFDLTVARKVGLSISLVNEKVNALLYTKERGNGASYFRQVVHMLYDIKSDCVLAKRILNSIWGALGQRNKKIESTTKEVSLNNGELLVDIKETSGGKFKVTYLKYNKYFKHNYARLACFLTSRVRQKMADIIYPYRSSVYSCHTDSILSDRELPHLVVGKYLGDFKLENQGKVYIHHSSKKLEWL